MLFTPLPQEFANSAQHKSEGNSKDEGTHLDLRDLGESVTSRADLLFFFFH